MNEELSLKLQAYADGELPEREAREVADLLAKDTDARALVEELKNTRSALVGFEVEMKLPESREFYWSKIERGIQRAEQREPAESSVSIFTSLRRFFVPAGTIAGLLIAGMLAWHQFSPTGRFGLEMETAFADSEAFTYRDYSKGMTLVWLSYPAENEFAEMVPGDTLD